MRGKRTVGIPAADARVSRVGSYVFLSWNTDGIPALAEAELETMRLALAGLSNRQIARRRGVASRTVANQLASIYKKLGVRSRFELMARGAGAVEK